jgi:hypothetical protein
MKIAAAILSGILATAVGVTATYLVMTKSLGYFQEPKKSVYPEGKGMQGGMGGFPGGGKDGKGDQPEGMDDKEGRAK